MSHALKWIKRRRNILSISALNAWLKLPPRTLQTYLETGRLQNAGKHLPVIELKMATIIANDAVMNSYITQMFNQWKESAAIAASRTSDTFKTDRPLIDINTARYEQTMNCLKLLNDILIEQNHPSVTFLHNQVRDHMPAFLAEFKKPLQKQAS